MKYYYIIVEWISVQTNINIFGAIWYLNSSMECRFEVFKNDQFQLFEGKAYVTILIA